MAFVVRFGRWSVLVAVAVAVLLLSIGIRRPTTTRTAITTPKDLGSLVDQDGKRFSFAALADRTVVMNFIFTRCPMSCPLQTRALAAVQRTLPKRLKDRVLFVSVSMDPARDTPPVLKQYAQATGADLTNWAFVTGDQPEITWLNEHYNAQVKRTADGQFDHRVAVYLLDAKQNLIQTYTGDFEQPRLAKEIGEVDDIYNKRERDRS